MVNAAEVPQKVQNYQRFGSEISLADEEFPVSANNRKLTDKYVLIILIVCVLTLIPFVAYTLYYSDINRLLSGYDNCGNVCGEVNPRYSWSCTGKDMRDKPFYDVKNHTCVSGDPTKHKERYKMNYNEDNVYQNENTINDINLNETFVSYMQRVGWKLTVACLIAIVLCQGTVLSFRYATAATVWAILIMSWLILKALVIVLWFNIANNSDAGPRVVVPGIIYTAVVLILLCIMVFMRDRIRLVIMLLKESTKAVFDMPMTFSIPLLGIIGGLIIFVIWATLTVHMISSGKLTEIANDMLDYELNGAMIFAVCFNAAMLIWAMEFIYGLQYMITSGAISKWYFTRDKSLLANPVKISAYITFKFHLGTVALGSLILTLVTILRITLKSLARNPRLRILINCCMSYLEEILRFFTKNAYIMTALHGTSFYQSGKKAATLIKLNICNILVLNYISDFVLGMAQIFIMAIAGLLTAFVFLAGEPSEHLLYCVLMVVIITGICSYIILGTIQTAVDSMFVCFCEDSVMNDGVTKPYFMTRGLMEFVEDSKSVFAETIAKKGLPTI